MSAPDPIIVRVADDTDLAAVCAFGAAVIPGFYAPILGEDAARDQADTWWSEAAMRPPIHAGDVVVAARGGDLVGVAQVDPSVRPPVVWKLYVRPQLRGVGLGPALLAKVVESLPETTTHLAIEHFAGNERAARFYEREGFFVERIDEHASGDHRKDVVWRLKRLR